MPKRVALEQRQKRGHINHFPIEEQLNLQENEQEASYQTKKSDIKRFFKGRQMVKMDNKEQRDLSLVK